jgi:hypothetical protein
VRGYPVGMNGNEPDLLGVYLNDHLAGATAGLELARRIAISRDRPFLGEAMDQIATGVAEDRSALLDVMWRLGLPPRRYKVYAGWAAEKAARLKPNRHVVRRSPLSSVVELEALCLGVEGKAAMWRVLRKLADRDERLDAARLDELLARAHQQVGILEELRLRRATEVLVPASRAAA